MMPTPKQELRYLRIRYLQEIENAAAKTSETTYGEWQDRIDGYLATLKPWLRPAEDLNYDRVFFNFLPGAHFPFHAYGYGFFRAWLRRQGLNPDDYHTNEPGDYQTTVSGDASSQTVNGEQMSETPNRLVAYRKKMGLTLEQVASLMGETLVEDLRRYEDGTRTPTLEHAIALEVILKIPVRMLFPGMASQARSEVENAQSSLLSYDSDAAA